ncbi:MAG TPA: tRNA (adenosine(37)-N6)-dimethylallyltransferase MiaA [Balneolaceae bacterium]|nr:tRNA (adenosine(37)-N6)-dimethylallyltransferase MiaA [Balneolaceae bacterium]
MNILLIGPTAVGKTSVSIELAHQINAEIISSDSRQCYKYMNIGTSTPTEKERQGIPHFNLSIIDPAIKDSAAKFLRRAEQWKKEISGRGHQVLYVGGSTLHQRVIIQPFDDVPDANENNIDKMERQIADEGIEPLYRRLQEVDPAYASRMDGMNTQRIIRALDVWMQTGRPFSSFHSNEPVTPPDELLVVGLERDRQTLYDRINRRVDRMFEQGFLDEVRSILDRGYSLEDPGLNTVGYKEAIAFLKDELTRDAMIRDIKTQTRRYAKRQLTYFRRWDFVHWLKVDGHSPQNIAGRIDTLLNRALQ